MHWFSKENSVMQLKDETSSMVYGIVEGILKESEVPPSLLNYLQDFIDLRRQWP